MQGAKRWKTTDSLPAHPSTNPESTVLIPPGVEIMEVLQPEGVSNPVTTRVFRTDGTLKVYIVSFADLEAHATRVDE